MKDDIVCMKVDDYVRDGGSSLELKPAELRRISGFMKSHYGVDLSEKSTLITGRLENKLARMELDSFDAFMDLVEKNPGGDEEQLLVNSLTTNHTFFMRENVHFDFLRDVALPEIKARYAATKDIRIWSAAASSGEEAYSIVMTVKDFFGFDAAQWDTKVLATDISTKVIETAREGIYRPEQVASLPTRWIKQHFTKLSNGDYQARQELRDEVIFNTFNLMDPFPWKKKFQVIFLRNVMIYFDEKTKRELIDKMYKFLEPGGYLFIGTTETIDKTATQLKHVQPSIYTKV